ncbi:MAG TPA: transcriptional coactivator p15/PC4 family protein [Verrucomicrobiae bacterium]|jgi:hypothetical protein|nr:transcriptional coactivator p15/PC4 family protein [Verrucomicrobiae bacterium]
MSSVNPPVFTLVKNHWEKIGFAVHDYGGHRIVDMRVWTRRKGGSGFLPTRKGICIPLNQLKAFREGLELLAKTVETALPGESNTYRRDAGNAVH